MAPLLKFETNHTFWTSTKPLTGKTFVCTILCRINEAFWERVDCQLLETFRDRQVCVWSMHFFKALYLEKLAIFTFVEEVWPNDIKLETTSCFIAEI